jgi:hypothetical protein
MSLVEMDGFSVDMGVMNDPKSKGRGSKKIGSFAKSGRPAKRLSSTALEAESMVAQEGST